MNRLSEDLCYYSHKENIPGPPAKTTGTPLLVLQLTSIIYDTAQCDYNDIV